MTADPTSSGVTLCFQLFLVLACDDDGFLISCSSCTCPVAFTVFRVHREDGLPFSAPLAAECLELFVIVRSSSTSPNRAPPRALANVSQHSLSQNVFFCAHVDPMSTQCRLNVAPMSTQCRPNVEPMSTQDRRNECGHYVHSMPTQCRRNVASMSTQCRFIVDPMSTQCRRNVDAVLTQCNADSMSTQYRHNVDPRSTHCPPNVAPMSTQCRLIFDLLFAF